MTLILTFVLTTMEKIQSQKKQYTNEFNYNFQQHAQFTLTKQIRTQTTN